MPLPFPILPFFPNLPTTKFLVPPFWIQNPQYHQRSQIPTTRVNKSWNSTLKNKSMK